MDEASVLAIVPHLVNQKTDIQIVRCLVACAQKQIHPIFAKDRWNGIPDIDYVRMAPALVLATYVLNCYETRLFHATVIGAPRTLAIQSMPNPLGGSDIPLSRIVRGRGGTAGIPRLLSVAEETAVANALLDMSTFMTLYISHEPEQFNALGYTRATRSLPVNAPSNESFIVMSQECFERLSPRSVSSPELLWDWFQMAMVLNHEVVHALNYFKFGNVEPEPIFEDFGFNELGAAWEVCLFNGTFPLLALTPGAALAYHPSSIDTPHGRVMHKTPHDRAEALQHAYAIVRIEWVIGLFTEEFWSQTWAGNGSLYPITDFLGVFRVDGY